MSQMYNDNTKRPKPRVSGPGESAAEVTIHLWEYTWKVATFSV